MTIKTRTKKPRRFWLKLFGVIACLCLFSLWSFGDKLVSAYRDRNAAYIFPTVTEAEGWRNPELIKTQELGGNAHFHSFNQNNSASLFTTGPTEDSGETQASEGSTSSDDGENTSIATSTESVVDETSTSTDSGTEEEKVPDETAEDAPSEQDESVDIPEPAAETDSVEDTSSEPVESESVPSSESGDSTEPVSWLNAWPKLIGLGLSVRAEEIPEGEEVPTGEEIETVPPIEEVLPEEDEASLEGLDYESLNDRPACVTLDSECRVIALSGFNLTESIKQKALSEVSLGFSMAYQGDAEQLEDDRLLVRYYHAGHWRQAGEIYLNKELSNFDNGGHFTQVLDDLKTWGDLSDVVVVFEYVGEGDAELYLDAAWLKAELEVSVAQMLEEDEAWEETENLHFELAGEDTLSENALLVDGLPVSLAYRDAVSISDLVWRVDKGVYYPRLLRTDGEESSAGELRTIIYAGVTNESGSTERLRIGLAMGTEEGKLRGIEQYMHNVPREVEEKEVQEVTYFCESAWQQMEGEHQCLTTGQQEECVSVSEDGLSCTTTTEIKTAGTVYDSAFVPVSVVPGALEDLEYPPGLSSAGELSEEITLEPGQTVYFRFTLDSAEAGEQRFFIYSRDDSSLVGTLDSLYLTDELLLLEVPENQKITPVLNQQVSVKANFDAEELPSFTFKFKSNQTSFFARLIERLFGGDEIDFSVKKTTLTHQSGEVVDIPLKVEYKDDGEWQLVFGQRPRHFLPGRYTLNLEFESDGDSYTDTVEFNWGVLVSNSDQSIYEPGQDANFEMAVLDDLGNTVCDAALDLVVTDPDGGVSVLPVSQSGECGFNNVTDVPDYSTSFSPDKIGDYSLTLTYLNEVGEALHSVSDKFRVEENEDFVIRRSGPTRIYPKAPYTMEITVEAKRDFAGQVTEKVPKDFLLVDKQDGELNQYGDTMLISWPVEMLAGETKTLQYTFDAPDLSPYLYLLGPAELSNTDGHIDFAEKRSWKIASDALGGYVELNQALNVTSASTWQTIDLSSYDVPANAVVEVSMLRTTGNNTRTAGARAVGSSLTRTFQITRVSGNDYNALSLHVQANATSSIQLFANNTDVVFRLLGYWTSGTYVETMQQIDPNITAATWGNINLSAYGPSAGSIVEMVVGNWLTTAGRSAGIRSGGSSVDRRVTLSRANNNGVRTATFIALATTSNATIQGYAQVEGANNADVDYWLAGYWSTAPDGLTYVDRNDTITAPTSTLTWTDRSLSGFGLGKQNVAEILVSNANTASGSLTSGARANGSSLGRSIALGQIITDGLNPVRMHAATDNTGSSTLELYASLTTNASYNLIGYWRPSNYAPDAPSLLDVPFDNEKTGTSTPKIRFSTTDPDGTNLVYQIQWDDDSILDDSPLGDRTSSNETGCSPNCFQNLTTPADTSPFNSGNQIEFTIQTALVSGTTYYYRVRATDNDGSGATGEWSEVRSFTYLAGTSPSQWFQTKDGQFDGNTLSGTETYGADSVRLADDPATDAIVVYGEGTVQTPRYRLWNGTGWSSESSAQSVGSTIQWTRVKPAATREEYALVTIGSGNNVHAQIFNTGAWGNLVSLGSVSDNTRRGVDISYENLSGDAVVVYCDGDSDPSYRVWNGSSWSSASSITTASANNCNFISMASDPVSDEIIVVIRDTGSQYEAFVWDGSAWGNTTTLGSMSETNNEGVDVRYEESGHQALVVASNGINANFVWTAWDGTDWSVASTVTLGDDFEWGSLKRDEGSDAMALCYVDEDSDVGAVRWNGESWSATTELNTGANGKTGRPIDCEFETTTGRDGYIMAVYTNTTAGLYRSWNGTSWATETTISTMQDSNTVETARTGDGKILSIFHDDASARYDFSSWDGSAWSNRETFETSPSVTATPFRQPISLAAATYNAKSGTVKTDPISFSYVSGQPTWGEVLWNSTIPSGTDLKMRVYYGATCSALVPDGTLPGNSTGFGATSSPLNLSGLSTSTYSQLCLEASLTSSNSNTPTLDDWTLSWERQPYLTQANYVWYANTNALTPTDQWPVGAAAIGQNIPISSTEPPNSGDVLRLRFTVRSDNVALSSGDLSLKLQYATGTLCVDDMAWSDVGAVGSTTAKWRGYDNNTVSDGATLSGLLITGADTAATYEEENNSATNPNSVSSGNEAEWDFALQHNADAGTNYCFRAVRDNGEALPAYGNYPAVFTNQAPTSPTLEKLFANERVASTTPWLEFSASDPEQNDITYEVEVDNNYDFSSPTIDINSEANFNDFTNLVRTADKDPFDSGATIRFLPTTSLANGTTYYWRVRAKDRNNSAAWGNWSSTLSFTVNSTTTITTWYQTTMEQFASNTHEDTEATTTNDVILSSGATVGTTTGSSIDFNDLTTGNAWGSLSWSHNVTSGSIRYYVEYHNGTDWELIPDSDLSGNSTGFTSSPVSLIGLDPTIYSSIRPVAVLTNSGGTPRLLDWTITWGLAVSQPTIEEPFDNAKVATTTPSFVFNSTDPQSDDLQYEVQVSASSSFAASTTRNSITHASQFVNLDTPADTNPFNDGESVSFNVGSSTPLTNGNTYWWRVRARDPAGGNAWSVWSTPRSFTVDTSITTAVWHQTTSDQFNTNTLNDVETVGAGSAQITSVVREAFAAYAEGTLQAPRYRIWNGSTWASQQTAQTVGDSIRFLETAAAPTRDEYLIVTQGATGEVKAQVYDGDTSTTGDLTTVDTAASATRRGFDVAYETSSGDAVVVSCDGTEATYKVWNGSSWSGASAITLAITNNCQWIQMASDPNSDEIILVVRDDTLGATDYQALVWNGSSWGNSMTTGSMSEVDDEGITVAYETSGNQAIVTVSNTTNASFIWNAWNGSAWSGATTQTIQDDFEGGRLAVDPGSDRLMLCYVDQDAFIGYIEWSGSAWGSFTTLNTLGNDKRGRPFGCEYETTSGRSGYRMFAYSDTTAARYRSWSGTVLSAEQSISTVQDSFEVRTTRTGDGNILGLFYDDVNTRYDFSYWNGSSWSTLQTLQDNSITTTNPPTVPFDIVSRQYPSFNSGAIYSTSLNFTDGDGPKWGNLTWNDSTPGSSDIRYHVEYHDGNDWALVPDSSLSGNNTGFTTNPVDLGGLPYTTYSTLRLRADFICNAGQCPTLNDWTLPWSAGIVVSGTAQAYDQSTNLTSGTVALAVNGVLQSGKTSLISGGNWSISNVTVFSGDVVTVFIDGAADSGEAVAVTKYDGVGDITGLPLHQRHLSIGSGDNASVTNSDIGSYDNSVSTDEDVFIDVDGSQNLSVCAVAGCNDANLYIKAGNTYRPSNSGAKTITLNSIYNNGTLTMDGNVFYIGHSWQNNATSTSDTSSVVMTATTSSKTIKTNGAAFNHLTLGQGSGTATWTLTDALSVGGNLSVNFGTLSPGALALNLSGNFSIGASGVFTKGSATTTFTGTGSSAWSDSTASKQDIGKVVIDGTSKTITIGTAVKATDLLIGSNDTLDVTLSNYALEIAGNFVNTNTFTARSGTVNFTATDAGNVIQSSSTFYRLVFNGSGGNWSFSNNSLTAGNDLEIQNGVLTLPNGTSTIGGSFINSASFQHNNGVVSLTGTGSHTITAGASPFYDLHKEGSGTYTFSGSATTSRHVIVRSGTLVLPSGTLAIGGNLSNTGGTLTHNSGTVSLFGGSTVSVALNGSALNNISFPGGGTYTMLDTNATVAGDLNIGSGSVTLPSGTLTLGGSLLATSGTFQHNNGSVTLNTSGTGRSIAVGNSAFNNLTLNSASGGWTFTGNATTTGSLTLTAVSALNFNPSVTLSVGGTFTNNAVGSSTNWSGSTLYLRNPGNFAVNTKTSSGDVYNTLRVGSSTGVKMWNSSATSTVIDNGGYLYSQDHATVDGSLYIFGTYTPASLEYWNYNTDFDGTTLSGTSTRAVDVRISNGSVLTFSSGLSISGTSTATTSVRNQGSGNYSLTIGGGTSTLRYFNIQDGGANGVSMSGTTTIADFRDGLFTLSSEGGSMLTLAGSVVDQTPTLQIMRIGFMTGVGVTTGSNVTVTGTPSSYWWFRDHYGDRDGEAFDTDPGGDPGNVRFDDSGVTISVSGTVYADDGITPLGSPTCDGSTNNVRLVAISSTGTSTYDGSCNATTGAFTLNGVSYTGDVTLFGFLNTNGGAKAVTVSRTPTGNITGFDLYQNEVMVRHEDAAPLTIENLAKYDSDNDSDLSYTAVFGATSTLTVSAGSGLFVAGNKTFAPGGNVTLSGGGAGATDGALTLGTSSTWTAAGSEAYSVGGSIKVRPSASFSAANSTVTLAGSQSGRTFEVDSAITLYDLTVSGSGTWSWSGSATTTISHAFSPNSGTQNGSAKLSITSGGLTGNGTLAFTGGLVEVGGGNLGSNTTWQFYDLSVSGSGTTTKNGTATTTVLGTLNIRNGHTLAMNSSVLDLHGTGTPLMIGGSLSAGSSTVQYSGNGSVTVSRAVYNNLSLVPGSAGNPTYSLAGGGIGFTINNFLIGGVNPVVANLNTNDPSVTVNGDVTVGSGSQLIASNVGALSVAGSWQNFGTFTHSSASITFNAAATGKIINPGSSVFNEVTFNGISGGWTITENATTTGAFTLQNASSFTVSSGKTLSVGGAFSNQVGGGATTWSGSTLLLNSGTSYSLNTKTAGGDQYGTLRVGANTDVRSWNSAADSYVTDSGASLYSQDHSAVDGDLYIFGSYERSSGGDYWSYGTDFDGTSLGTSSRAVSVRLQSGASVALSGGVLDIIGAASATTTINNQGSGSYSVSVSGGTLNASYYSFRQLGSGGVSISGTPTISSLSNGEWWLAQNGNTLLTVASTAINQNPSKIISNAFFGFESGVTTGTNVQAVGSSTSFWRFSSHGGALSGEAFDNDPAGDPGYLVWDDSASSVSIAGNVYSNESGTVSSVCDGSTPVVRLKVQGAGNYTASCNASTGAYSFAGFLYNPGDVLTVYLDTNGGAKAANITTDPVTVISNMHLYHNRLVVRHEDTAPITIAKLSTYDSDADSDIPFNATDAATDTLVTATGTKLIVWDSKTFAPAGNITLPSNGSGAAEDGTLEVRTGGVLSASGNQTHSIGGSFLLGSSATFDPANSTVTLTATTTGKTVNPQNSSFYNLTFNGTGGNWSFAGGNATTTNDFTVTAGTVTLGSGTTTVGGSFSNFGTLMHNNGSVVLTSTASGKTVRLSGNDLRTLVFSGIGGGWTFSDVNATTTGSVLLQSGAITMPSGTWTVGRSFINSGGTITHNNGSLYFIGSGTEALTFGGSSLSNLYFAGGGSYTITDGNATSTGNITIGSGSLALATGTLAIGGSFTSSSGTFAHASGTVLFNATTTGKTINPGSSSFNNLIFQSSGGGWTITEHATSTGNFALNQATSFTLSSGKTLSVGGAFTNSVGGSATTWSGTTLRLLSGSSFIVGAKSVASEAYNTLEIQNGTKVKMWNSAATTTTVTASSSLYSQDHNSVDGSLYIWGQYVPTGDEYWSYATDFDGTALGGGSRAASVRLASSSSITIASTSLNMVGTASATTTIETQGGVGTYSFSMTNGTLNANYHRWRNLDINGLSLSGTPSVTSFSNGDFELGINGGSMISLTHTVLNTNANLQLSGMSFALAGGVSSGYNVNVSGSPSAAWTVSGSGNRYGEAYDNDGGDACGYVRWSDSSCLFVSQEHYRWRNNDGSGGAQDSQWYNASWSTRQRVGVKNNTSTAYTNTAVKLTVNYDGLMQADFDDLRFTSDNGTTSIPYWIEKYTASNSATVWVKVPSLSASGSSYIYMYFGNAGASDQGSGTSTFTFFDDFEDDNISEYSGSAGDLSLFDVDTTFAHNHSYGLDAGSNVTAKTNDGGIRQAGSFTGTNKTIRFFQSVNGDEEDEPCTLFGVQASGQNYAVCLDQYPNDRLVLAKNVTSNDGSGTALSSTSVTYPSGAHWYEVVVDWLSGGTINVTVYDENSSVFATTTAVDTTYSSGGMGFSFWAQHGGWDFYSSRDYMSSAPTIAFGANQSSGGASFAFAEDNSLTGGKVGDFLRLRFSVQNTGTDLTNQTYRVQYADQGSQLNCESVPYGSYTDVPTSGSCSGNPICMATSSQFADGDTTSGLLSYPATMGFSLGRMVEEPSNQTAAYSVLGNTATEMEYALRLTTNATANSYCLRVKNATSSLDNYTRMAKLLVVQAPFLTNLALNNANDIALTEGASTTVYVTATVTDYNGWEDISLATTTVYRNGVSANCAANDNNCYRIPSNQCVLSACSGNSCSLTCSAAIQYLADPTDVGTYASDDWRAEIRIVDSAGEFDADTTLPVDLLTLYGLDVLYDIDFGALEVGQDTGTTTALTTAVNTGNSNIDIQLEGTDLTDGSNSIPVGQQKYATSTFAYSACSICNLLSGTATNLGVNLPKPTDVGTDISQDVYWGIAIPSGTAATEHQGTNTFWAAPPE